MTSHDALQLVLDDKQLRTGIRAAIRRLVTPDDQEFMTVEDDGTPTTVANLQKQLEELSGQRIDDQSNNAKQLEAANKAKEAAERQAKDLQQRLEAAQQAGSGVSDEIKLAAKEVVDAVNAFPDKNGIPGTIIREKDPAVTAAEKLNKLANN